MVLVVKPNKPNTTLWAVVTPGFYFDCAVSAQQRVLSLPFAALTRC